MKENCQPYMAIALGAQGVKSHSGWMLADCGFKRCGTVVAVCDCDGIIQGFVPGLTDTKTEIMQLSSGECSDELAFSSV